MPHGGQWRWWSHKCWLSSSFWRKVKLFLQRWRMDAIRSHCRNDTSLQFQEIMHLLSTQNNFYVQSNHHLMQIGKYIDYFNDLGTAVLILSWVGQHPMLHKSHHQFVFFIWLICFPFGSWAVVRILAHVIVFWHGYVKRSYAIHRISLWELSLLKFEKYSWRLMPSQFSFYYVLLLNEDIYLKQNWILTTFRAVPSLVTCIVYNEELTFSMMVLYSYGHAVI